jgi:hypothetical protein
MRLVIFTAIILLSTHLMGCAGNSNEGSVSGNVTLDGQPLQTGTITFTPVDGKTATAGGTITAGEYNVQAPIGEKRVQITAPKVVGKHKVYEDLPDSPIVDTITELLPLRYHAQSKLTYSVTAGKQSKDFELTSK